MALSIGAIAFRQGFAKKLAIADFARTRFWFYRTAAAKTDIVRHKIKKRNYIFILPEPRRKKKPRRRESTRAELTMPATAGFISY